MAQQPRESVPPSPAKPGTHTLMWSPAGAAVARDSRRERAGQRVRRPRHARAAAGSGAVQGGAAHVRAHQRRLRRMVRGPYRRRCGFLGATPSAVVSDQSSLRVKCNGKGQGQGLGNCIGRRVLTRSAPLGMRCVLAYAFYVCYTTPERDMLSRGLSVCPSEAV